MAYVKQNFKSGQVLRATQLNNIENEICKKVNLPTDSNGNINFGVVGQFAVSDGNGGIIWKTTIK